ncbi:hypothetical protein INR49_022699, partial [Caranx melampygus]
TSYQPRPNKPLVSLFFFFLHPPPSVPLSLLAASIKDQDCSVLLMSCLHSSCPAGTLTAGTMETYRTLCFLLSLKHVSSVHNQFIAHPGDNVILPCAGGRGDSIEAVEWKKDGLQAEYVLFCRKGESPYVQHPSYEGRVELANPLMENSNASLILKNVTRDDSGVFDCHISNGTVDHSIPHSSLGTTSSCRITLTVSDPTAGGEEEGGNTTGGGVNGNDGDSSNKNRRLGLLAVAPLVLSLACSVFFFYMKKKSNQRATRNIDHPPDLWCETAV